MLDKEIELLESELNSFNTMCESPNSGLKNDLDNVLGDIEYTLKSKNKIVPQDWKNAAKEITRLADKYL